jgi:ribosomal protein S18 acetylase RimI-like enzyme
MMGLLEGRPGQVIARQAEFRDLRDIQRVTRDAYLPAVQLPGVPPWPLSAQPVASTYRRPVWVLEVDDAVVAVTEMAWFPKNIYVGNIAVTPAVQRRGYGRILVGLAEIMARRCGLGTIRLSTSAYMQTALGFYGHLGFRETARYKNKGYPFVELEKYL